MKKAAFLAGPALAAFLGLLAHEAGHAAAAIACGGRVTQVVLAPGLRIYPTLDMVPWNGTFGSVWTRLPGATAFHQGMVTFMGCGTTALMAALAVPILWIRPRVPGRWFLLAVAFLWPLDILSYSIFPSLGFRHWIVLGGTEAEPLLGTAAMRIPAGLYFSGLAVFLVAHYGALRRIIPK